MSQTVVLKFGGTSLGTPHRLRRAALRVRRHRREGRSVVVVVSATGSTTDRIVRWLSTSAPMATSVLGTGREQDRALATGEDLAAALLAAALGSIGVPALSMRGGEAGMEATGEHRAGALHRVGVEKLRSLLEAGTVPVVAGFQAVLADGETVTLGRGASDLTAVAIAGALGAECHIVTDVDGIYNADPRTIPGAQRHDRMTHEALVSLTQHGGRVVHAGAACHAQRSGVPLRVYHFRSRLKQPTATFVSGTPALVVSPRVRHVRIALAGCGVVGGEFARLILQCGDAIAARHGVRLELVRVLVRRGGIPRPVPSALLTTDLDTFLSTGSDMAVEALGGREPADRIAQAMLSRGARVVTANKLLVAAMGDDLARLAAGKGGTLDFEAAVGAGIPIVRTLRDALSHAPVRSIRGILNGTSNHVLTSMQRGSTFDAAVIDAQRLGFAEADPTRDLDGSDAADKIAILAWLAFGVPPASLAVKCSGITADADDTVRAALAGGRVLRQIAECTRTSSGVTASVQPVVVGADSAFGRTELEQNLIQVELEWGGTIGLSGPGAGAASTASALLGDVLRACASVPPALEPAVERSA